VNETGGFIFGPSGSETPPTGGGCDESGPAPELTVSMPAFNTKPYIKTAIESALRQEDVQLELIVVDDGSRDGTFEAANSISDPRLRVFQNPENRGVSFCHNRVVRNSRAPFILHLDSDDFVVRPRAFRKLLDLIKSSDDIGLVHAHFVFVDRDGKASWPALREMRRRQLRSRVPGRDYRSALLSEGSVMNYLRLFRRSALQFLGPFNEDLRYGEDLEMALRLAEHFRIEVVPEALAAVRVHEHRTTNFRFQSLRYWRQRLVMIDRLHRSGQISYANRRFVILGAALASILARKLVP
jgi:glycosyltransferase involved in cell wall biosynthesis